MKNSLLLLPVFALFVSLVFTLPILADESYTLSFSTYIGGSAWEHARDVCADANGDIYVCGGTASKGFI